MNRRYGLVLLSAALLSTAADANCDHKEDPVALQQIVTPGNFEVVKLFDVDGGTVYRFKDTEKDGDNQLHYFILPVSGRPAEVTTAQRCGKHCQVDDAVMVALR